jgi:hypothetical protein
VRAEAIVIGLLFSGAVACSSIIGTRDLVLDETDPSNGGGATPSVKTVIDGAEAGATHERADANEDPEPEADASTTTDAGATDAQVSRGPNLASENGVTTSATTTYKGFPSSRLVDGDLATSWYPDTNACTTAATGFSCAGVYATVILAASRTVGRLVIHGNHDQFNDYDVVTGRWELVDTNGAVAATANVTLAPPNHDGTTVLPTSVRDVAAVRFVILTGDAPEPGMSEIEIYAR